MIIANPTWWPSRIRAIVRHFKSTRRKEPGNEVSVIDGLKFAREKAVGAEDVKVTAINMYKYKERLRLYKRWPCSTNILNRINRIN